MSSNTEEERRLPPIAAVDAIDKWVHSQTRFHLPDTDDYKEMLTNVADVFEQHESTLKAEYEEKVKQAEDEIKQFAVDVAGQFAYEPEDGQLTSGGLSTLETAFNILRRNGLLDKRGRYSSSPKNGEPS